MPRLKAIKPTCPRCGSTRFVGCYLGRWFCFGLHRDGCLTEIRESEAQR